MTPANTNSSIQGGIRSSINSDGLQQPVTLTNNSYPLVFPLIDYHGHPVPPQVQIGEIVKAGSVLAKGIIASRSGHIKNIEERSFIHRSGQPALCVVLAPSGDQTYKQLPPLDLAQIESLEPYNILGLGGAAFPLLRKLTTARDSGIKTLLINAVECEPLVHCDHALMQWQTNEVLLGIDLLTQLCGLQSATIAIKAAIQTQSVIDKLHKAQLELQLSLDIIYVEDKYPAGAERTLVQALTQTKTSGDLKPSEQGILCVNVATAHALYNANIGKALTERIISVANSLSIVENVRAPFGTAICDVLECAGIHNYQGSVIAGGPISGHEIQDLTLPIDASTNSLIINPSSNEAPSLPCIRCGDCAEVCPSNLLPQQLYWYGHSDNVLAAKKYGITDCIECACCDLVCPSSIPLTQLFRHVKRNLSNTYEENARAEWAEQRYQQHLQRQSTRTAIRKQTKRASNPLDRLQKMRQKKTSEAKSKPHSIETSNKHSTGNDSEQPPENQPPPDLSA